MENPKKTILETSPVKNIERKNLAEEVASLIETRSGFTDYFKALKAGESDTAVLNFEDLELEGPSGATVYFPAIEILSAPKKLSEALIYHLEEEFLGKKMEEGLYTVKHLGLSRSLRREDVEVQGSSGYRLLVA